MKGQPNSTNICPVVCKNCCLGGILIRWGPSFPTLSYIISVTAIAMTDMTCFMDLLCTFNDTLNFKVFCLQKYDYTCLSFHTFECNS